MRLYRTFASLRRSPATGARAVSIGVFDGLHIGHQAILERARRVAHALAGSSLVLTFEPTPKEFFSPATAPPRLTRFRERFELLE
jgi:riboflavin kinase/FMN adenylyltransferase